MMVASVRRCSLLALALSAVTAFASGCSSADDAATNSGADELTRSISPSHLVDDSAVKLTGMVDAEAVQSVLSASGGTLATYREGGKRAADIIAAACNDNGITAGYLLARIQGESGLVTGGSAKNVSHATGCGCPDGQRCSPSDAGFTQQVQCTAESMKTYFDEIDSSGHTISGWGPGIIKSTFDPCAITPANAATAALYTYTPWVGSYGIGCGTSASGGSSEIAVLTTKYAAKVAAASNASGSDADGG